MTTVHLSPILQDAQFDSNGAYLSGGKIYWYFAGTSTPTPVYTDNAGVNQHTNPIILNSTGQTPAAIWLADGISYKAILKTSNDVSIGLTFDDITGVNTSQSGTSTAEWIPLNSTLTYISGTSFAASGDVTSTILPGRRLKFTVTVGTLYGTVISAVYGTSTTITVSMDSGALDTGLTAVSYGILAPTNSSIPKAYTDGWGGTAGGTADALTITVQPAIGAYVAGQTFKFIPSANNVTTTPTLNVCGLGAKTIRGRSSSGSSPVLPSQLVIGQEMSVVYDGTYFILEVGGGSSGSQTFTANGSFSIPVCNYIKVLCIGAGGGGGGGRRGAAGTQRTGGAGGAGGFAVERIFTPIQLSSPVTIAVGIGGTSGTAASSNDTNGGPGGSGGQSSFGSYLVACGGGGGAGGSTAVSNAQAGGPDTLATVSSINSYFGAGGSGGSDGTITPQDGGISCFSSTGGGGGGSITSGDVEALGGNGGQIRDAGLNTLAAGGVHGAPGSSGNQCLIYFTGSGGGGGNGSKTVTGNGGNGAIAGGGGGGGGASLNGVNSGAGGNGGRGEVRVWWW
jgi:hypothetical protein